MTIREPVWFRSMAATPILHVRTDEDMLVRIERLAAEWKTDKSVVVRRLLATALGDPTQVQVAQEVVMVLSKERKLLLSRFNDALQGVVEDMQREVSERQS